MALTPKIGKPAPDITLNNPDGKSVSLSSLRGKYVLIDFWASWCGPCRQENPNVVRMYNKFKGKNFEIFGVSLDKEKDKWLAAIEKDKLTWTHVSDLKFWQFSGRPGLPGQCHSGLLSWLTKRVLSSPKTCAAKPLEHKLEEILK